MSAERTPYEIAEARIDAREAEEVQRQTAHLESIGYELKLIAQRDKHIRELLCEDNALAVLRDISCLDEKFENSFVKRMERPEDTQLSLGLLLMRVLCDYDMSQKSTLAIVVQHITDTFCTPESGSAWVELLEADLAEHAEDVDAHLDVLGRDKGVDPDDMPRGKPVFDKDLQVG